MEKVQLVPVTQAPEPVHPVPPHCEYLGKLPAAAVLEVEALAVVVDVERVVGAVVVTFETEVGALLAVEPGEELLTTTPPGPATDVVKDPDSI